MSSISGLSPGASDLLAQLQQQLLGGFASTSAQNSTDSVSQSGALALFGSGGDDTTSWAGASITSFSSNSTDTSPTGGPIAFGPGILAAIVAQLEAQASSAGGATTPASTTSNSTDPTSNSADAVSNSTDAPPANPLAQVLFSALSNGGSTITKSDLENAFVSNGGTANGADALYAQITGSSNSTDGITLAQFEAPLQQPAGPGGAGGVGGHHHGDGGEHGGGGNALSALFGNSSTSGSSSANGTTQTVTNADGSTTTTITEADGTTITINQPASVANSTASASNGTNPADTNGTSNSSDTNNSQWLANFEAYMANMLQTQNALFNSTNLGNQLSLSV